LEDIRDEMILYVDKIISSTKYEISDS